MKPSIEFKLHLPFGRDDCPHCGGQGYKMARIAGTHLDDPLTCKACSEWRTKVMRQVSAFTDALELLGVYRPPEKEATDD